MTTTKKITIGCEELYPCYYIASPDTQCPDGIIEVTEEEEKWIIKSLEEYNKVQEFIEDKLDDV